MNWPLSQADQPLDCVSAGHGLRSGERDLQGVSTLDVDVGPRCGAVEVSAPQADAVVEAWMNSQSRCLKVCIEGNAYRIRLRT